jgi:predicted metal-binding protein
MLAQLQKEFDTRSRHKDFTDRQKKSFWICSVKCCVALSSNDIEAFVESGKEA